MATALHRLQISLPRWQLQFLNERAQRDGVSLAEVVRQLIEREAEASRSGLSADSVWSIVGIAEDSGALIAEKPVSEYPDLYLAAATESRPRLKRVAPLRRARRRGR